MSLLYGENNKRTIPNIQSKTDLSGSAIKTLAATSFARSMKATHMKKPLLFGNLQNNHILAAKTQVCDKQASRNPLTIKIHHKLSERCEVPSEVGFILFDDNVTHATTSNGCPKNLIAVLASPRQISNKMKNAKNNTQQRILSTISLP